MNYAAALKSSALGQGASESMSGNAAWALLFTAGFVINAAYCAGLILKRGNAAFFARETARNTGLVAVMALMWIGSLYLYGMGAARLGKWGGIIGWPMFISLAILVGNLWGLWRGEWAGAAPAARARFRVGLAVLVLSVAIYGLSSALKSS